MENKNIIPYLRITGVYFIFSSIWIFLSDYVLLLFLNDIDSYRYLSTIKGMFFIAISSMIIYYLVKKEVDIIKKVSIDIATLKEYDILTNTSNRIAFSKRIDELYISEEDVSILIIDINGLKKINESHSFEKGDEVIKSMLEIVKGTLSQNSKIYRINGGQFCVIIEHCDYNEVYKYASLILSKIENNTSDSIYSVSIGYSTTCKVEHNIYQAMTLAEDRMIKSKLLSNMSSRHSVIKSLQSTLFERSDETEMHSNRMTEICKNIGLKLNFSFLRQNDLTLLALLHDIGKIGVSDSILNKPGTLTPEEYNIIKEHSTIGSKITSVIPSLSKIAILILHHHERWDGKGYPDKLSGEEIPLCSRILSVVDAYDAMTNDRVYRLAISKEEAIKEIIKNKGTQFDPLVVEVFLEVIK